MNVFWKHTWEIQTYSEDSTDIYFHLFTWSELLQSKIGAQSPFKQVTCSIMEELALFLPCRPSIVVVMYPWITWIVDIVIKHPVLVILFLKILGSSFLKLYISY